MSVFAQISHLEVQLIPRHVYFKPLNSSLMIINSISSYKMGSFEKISRLIYNYRSESEIPMDFVVTESGSTIDEVKECVKFLQEGGYIKVSEKAGIHENSIHVNRDAISKFQKIF